MLFLCGASWAAVPALKGGGARPLALGNAYAALADDGSAIFVNPAGLASIPHLNLTSLYTQLENDILFTSFGGALPNFLGGTVGFGYRNSTISNISVSDEVVSNTTEDLLFFYSRKIRENLSLSADFRFISTGFSKQISGQEGAYGGGQAIDLGLKFTPRPGVGIGLSLQNLGGKVSYRDNTEDEIAGNTILGLSLLMRENLRLNVDLSKAVDEPQALLHAGMEWRVINYFALRFGLDQTPKAPGENYTHLAFGFGLNYRGTTFDYTYYKKGDLSQAVTHYFSLGYVGPGEIKEEKRPEPPPLPTPEAVIQRKEVIKRVHFKDIAEDYWAKEEIELLATAKLISGFPDGTFRPKEKLWYENRFITRAEMAKILGIDKEIKRPNDFITRAEFAVLLSQTYRGQAAIKRLPLLEK